ncbi:MAG: glutamyl-tRNA reductase [Saprospirales bacterium]|nr:glutamyl-tRNA reductase [Saprospirales bacterium]
MLKGYHILTVTHRNTPLSLIGSFLFNDVTEDELPLKLEALKAVFGLEELLYVATCNRVIFLLHSSRDIDASFPQQFFNFVNPDLDKDLINKHVIHYQGDEAVQHLFKVAASIDSLVVGEREILRQLREAYQRCLDWKLTGDKIRLLMDQAIVAAKDVYSNTRLGEKSVSVVSLAIRKMMDNHLPKSARILMVGAGQTNVLVSKFLVKYGFSNVTVFNRTIEKARNIAKKFSNGKALDIAELEHFTGGFDCLIVCTGATKAIVDRALYARLLNGESGSKIAIDLSVPHNIDASITSAFDVKLIEVEGLKKLAKQNLHFREQEVEQAMELLSAHLQEFKSLFRTREIELAFRQIPQEVKAVREKAMNEVFRKELEHLDENSRSLVERMLTYMEKKCTGIPMRVAREALVVKSS